MNTTQTGRHSGGDTWTLGEFALLAGLLLCHAFAALWSASDKCCSADELAHFTSGHAYWAHNASYLNPENGILPQRWAALPAFLQGLTPPDPNSEAWARADVWNLGTPYLYDNAAPPELMLFDARAMNLCWNLALGLLVYGLSRRLFGRAGAMFSLFFLCASPTMLANGVLITSDACGAFWLLASTSAFIAHLARPTLGSLLLSTLTFALTCIAKFNAVLLLPVCGVLLVYSKCALGGTAHQAFWAKPWRHLLGGLLSHLAGALLLIWGAHGFGQTTPPPVGSYYFPWDLVIPPLGWKGTLIVWLRDHHLLPHDYLLGFATVLFGSLQRGSYLLGETSLTGWWYFFPVSFLAKSTVALLLCFPLLAWLGLRNPGTEAARHFRKSLCQPALLAALVLGAIYGAAALATNLNIGHRHILPLYPVLFLLLGALGAGLWRLGGSRGPLLYGALLVLQCAETAWVFPNVQSHFNPLAGGPEKGHRILVDSSLDWGQDLPSLQRWLEKSPDAKSAGPVFVAYFGVAKVAHHVPRSRLLAGIPFVPGAESRVRAEAGLYCISATLLEQPYTPPREWNAELERTYQQLRPHAERLHKALAAGTEGTEPPPKGFWYRFEELRLMRLCGYLRDRKPDANINGSILVYRLGQAEVDAALHGNLSAWVEARVQLQDQAGKND